MLNPPKLRLPGTAAIPTDTIAHSREPYPFYMLRLLSSCLTANSFTGPPIRVLVSEGPNSHVVSYFVHASVVYHFSNWFRVNFEQCQSRHQAQAQGVQMTPDPNLTSRQECTLKIPNLDPEVFELYMNWQYTERFPNPINMPYDNPVYSDDDDNSEGGDSITGDGNDEAEGNYFRHALLFLTKAHVLGRKVHVYFQLELAKIIREVQSRMMLGRGGCETTIEGVVEASRIVAEN